MNYRLFQELTTNISPTQFHQIYSKLKSKITFCYFYTKATSVK